MAKRIIFKPHLVENPNTYVLQDNLDGTHTLVPATGNILQQGTPLSSDNLNNTEQEMLLTALDTSVSTSQIVISIEGITTTEEIPNNLLVKVKGNVVGASSLVVMDGNPSTIATYAIKAVDGSGEIDLTSALYDGSYVIFALDHANLKAFVVSSAGGSGGSTSGAILSDGTVQMNVGYIPTQTLDVVTKEYADLISELREIPVDENEPTGEQVLWLKIIQ